MSHVRAMESLTFQSMRHLVGRSRVASRMLDDVHVVTVFRINISDVSRTLHIPLSLLYRHRASTAIAIYAYHDDMTTI